MRDSDYRLILEKVDEEDGLQMIDIAKLSDGFTGDMLGEGGWLDLYSKYGDCKEYMGKK